MKNYNLVPFNQRTREGILAINIALRQDFNWNECSQKRNNAYYRLHVPLLFDVAGKQRPTNASASVSWTWSSLEEEQSGWGGFRSPRHNKPFHGRQNTSHGAAITKAQRCFIMRCDVANCQDLFDKGGGHVIPDSRSVPSPPPFRPFVVTRCCCPPSDAHP